ncbi:hypothetical protein C1645_829588 [Glomus cerebriforme]|uniref:Uncharacterized protein n=1 Tax=Glomus cerebriforme TaxID=658196 RepID=A0A397SNQ7_9GLOM|nr:hypothetical protein C1645_829588 [Glomus cerebriforme]
MCKLHTYYITNAKRELPYYSTDTSENSLREKMIETIMGINIESQIFNMERRDSEDVTVVNQRRQTVLLASEHEDYDIEALIAREMEDNE